MKLIIRQPGGVDLTAVKIGQFLLVAFPFSTFQTRIFQTLKIHIDEFV